MIRRREYDQNNFYPHYKSIPKKQKYSVFVVKPNLQEMSIKQKLAERLKAYINLVTN